MLQANLKSKDGETGRPNKSEKEGTHCSLAVTLLAVTTTAPWRSTPAPFGPSLISAELEWPHGLLGFVSAWHRSCSPAGNSSPRSPRLIQERVVLLKYEPDVRWSFRIQVFYPMEPPSAVLFLLFSIRMLYGFFANFRAGPPKRTCLVRNPIGTPL